MTKQAKSAALCSQTERLERLRLAAQETWEQIAARLGLSESMIYQVKRGKRTLSEKALFRLASAEIELGILPPLLARLHFRNLETAGSDPDGMFEEILKCKDWNSDDEAQLAAILGDDLLGKSVLIDWDLLERYLKAFIDLVAFSVKQQRRVCEISTDSDLGCEETNQRSSLSELLKTADLLEEQIPSLKRGLDRFKFGLERLLDKESNDGDDAASSGSS